MKFNWKKLIKMGGDRARLDSISEFGEDANSAIKYNATNRSPSNEVDESS